MQHHYGLDLRLLARDESPRRVQALVRGLPEEALTWSEEVSSPSARPQNVVSISEFVERHKEQHVG